ncbi:iron-sulfur cluster binding protein, putative [Halobacteroides halobius DSM 5150]|uniref:Iron-sulfur cluster binding protein, putative n=1 Tax=Halobacteroides halobius (strain ATCC 35273 / DSM 5150 / MD-1) TaxID=748449 RepID=L0K5R4_HALHC|nr:tRNA epoxyqueuosine(34) reductase QueG [Halobacteroides halobius]AGB40336.1 iron-sulfur cluster binding protein, putative [Halobacteroides halobius DSM 5150]
MKLKSKINQYATKLGIDKIGITTTDDFSRLRDFLYKMREKEFLSKFVKKDLELITDPKEVLSNAKSVIVCAISYQVDDVYITESKEKTTKELRGKLSRFAWGQDYHHVLGKKLDKLVQFLQREEENLKAKTFVDTGPTIDRALARRAGIGWQGKNCSIINPEYGSWIFIGGIITNLDLEIDQPIEDQCGDCRKCLDACPTGALKAPYTLDSRKCLGYLTLKRGYIDRDNRKKFGTRLWGCDTCQEVCPSNQEVEIGDHKEFRPQKLAAYPKLPQLLSLTKSEYRDKFGPTPMNWRGKRPIQRNAAIILGNLGDKEAVPYLIEALEDPKPIVRAHAAWALAEIGDGSVVDDLKKVLVKEKEERVKEEVQEAINQF